MNITSKCNMSFTYESCSKCYYAMQSPVLCAVEVPNHKLEGYQMLFTRVGIVPAQNSDGIGDIVPSGGHGVHMASDCQLVYGGIQASSSGFHMSSFLAIGTARGLASAILNIAKIVQMLLC